MNILIIVVDVPWSDFISELYAIAVEGAWSLRFAPERCILFLNLLLVARLHRRVLREHPDRDCSRPLPPLPLCPSRRRPSEEPPPPLRLSTWRIAAATIMRKPAAGEFSVSPQEQTTPSGQLKQYSDDKVLFFPLALKKVLSPPPFLITCSRSTWET